MWSTLAAFPVVKKLRRGLGNEHARALEKPRYNRLFAIGVGLDVAYLVFEVFYGWQIDSLALIADAGHNLSDVAGLLLAWSATYIARFRPTMRHTFGWQKASVMAALINAVLLLVAMGSLITESIQRLQSPVPMQGVTVIAVAAVGIVIDIVAALLFVKSEHADLNLRAAFLHFISDALVSLGILVAGTLYLWFEWLWLDPILSLLISIAIIFSAVNLFKKTLHMMFDGVPESIDLKKVYQYLKDLEGVVQVDDLHVWAMSTSDIALMAHLVIPTGNSDDGFIGAIRERMLSEFNISHATVQITKHSISPQCVEFPS